MKNLTTIFTFFVALAIFSSCVSKKKYEEALAAAAAEKSALESELASAQEESAKLQEQSNKLQQDFNMSQEENFQAWRNSKREEYSNQFFARRH